MKTKKALNKYIVTIYFRNETKRKMCIVYYMPQNLLTITIIRIIIMTMKLRKKKEKKPAKTCKKNNIQNV